MPHLGHAELEDAVGGLPAGPLVVGAEGPAEGDQGFGAGLLDGLPAGLVVRPAVARRVGPELPAEVVRVEAEGGGDGLPGRAAGAEFGGAVEERGGVGGCHGMTGDGGRDGAAGVGGRCG